MPVLTQAKELKNLLRKGYVSKFDFIVSNFKQIVEPLIPDPLVELIESDGQTPHKDIQNSPPPKIPKQVHNEPSTDDNLSACSKRSNTLKLNRMDLDQVISQASSERSSSFAHVARLPVIQKTKSTDEMI